MSSPETLLPDGQAAQGGKQSAAEHYGRPASELRGYAGVMAVYAVGVGAATLAMWRKKRLPASFSAKDLALVALATHKLSRTLARDAVTSPLRAPFTRFEGSAGPGEVKEKVAARGAEKSVGELITCPFCLDQWVATGFVTGLAVAPRLTRYIAAIFAARAGADFIHFGYAAAEQATT
ncbi:MAG TPA: DUF1360 domain-containing protein [Mycobacteriales bacterium]|nr:DUF1360 domain-containing protein [Mycobacteriales bacterium]